MRRQKREGKREKVVAAARLGTGLIEDRDQEHGQAKGGKKPRRFNGVNRGEGEKRGKGGGRLGDVISEEKKPL